MIKGTWKTINGNLHKTKQKKTNFNYFKDGENILAKNVITNKFNEYFIKKTSENKSFQQYLSQKYTMFKFQNINEQDVFSITINWHPNLVVGLMVCLQK